MLRLASDGDVRGEIIRGLRRRLPEIDLVRVQDVLPEGAPDPEVLAWTFIRCKMFRYGPREV